MIPYYDDGGYTIYHGDCREVLPILPPNSVGVDGPAVWTQQQQQRLAQQELFPAEGGSCD